MMMNVDDVDIRKSFKRRRMSTCMFNCLILHIKKLWREMNQDRGSHENMENVQ